MVYLPVMSSWEKGLGGLTRRGCGGAAGGREGVCPRGVHVRGGPWHAVHRHVLSYRSQQTLDVWNKQILNLFSLMTIVKNKIPNLFTSKTKS